MKQLFCISAGENRHFKLSFIKKINKKDHGHSSNELLAEQRCSLFTCECFFLTEEYWEIHQERTNQNIF